MSAPNISRPPECAAGVERINEDLHGWCDDYRGSADALVAAGLITVDQLPGQPGRNKVQCSYYRGEPIRKGVSNIDRDEHYLRIACAGGRAGVELFVVSVGIPLEEQERRRQRGRVSALEGQRQQATFATASTAATTSRDVDDPKAIFKATQRQGSAELPVGAIVTDIDGDPLVIARPFDAYCVDGKWRCGYAARDGEGRVTFYSACELFTPAGKPTHLRLVSRDSSEASAS